MMRKKSHGSISGVSLSKDIFHEKVKVRFS